MRTMKTLLAAAILGVSAIAGADTVPVTPVYPYAPVAYPYAPVAIDADRVKASAEHYNRFLQASFEQAQRAWAAAIDQQRKRAEDFQKFHNDSLQAASLGNTVSLDDIRRQAEALREETSQMSNEIRERLFSADRGATRAYLDAKAAAIDARFADAERQMSESRKAADDRLATALQSPLTQALPPVPAGPPF